MYKQIIKWRHIIIILIMAKIYRLNDYGQQQYIINHYNLQLMS